MRDEFNLTPGQMLTEIQGLLERTVELLAKKDIPYDGLRSALVPSQDRREIALIFDTAKIDDAWYGLPVHEHILPLFEIDSCHSVLVGDLLDHRMSQDRLYDELVSSLVIAGSSEYRHSTQYYAVYINNLTASMVSRFHQGLSSFSPFIGHIDCTYRSMIKTYLSTVLVNEFLKYHQTILQPHEDDLDDAVDQNTHGYPFAAHGWLVRSVPSTMFEVLLSYKIERPVYPGFEADTELALSAVSTRPSRLEGFEVVIEPQKLEYLAANKTGSLQKAGLLHLSVEAVEAALREQLQSNYIYSLCEDREHNVVKFNTIVEFRADSGPCRLTVALEYLPDASAMRLITMY